MMTVTMPKTGTIAWTDLTVPDAGAVRDFYRQVIGWEAAPCDMGGYSDYNMLPPGSPDAVAGICHARGANAGIPPVWLVYIIVPDVDRSAADCTRLGGRILDGPRSMGTGRFAVIADPVGAICALYQPESDAA